MDKLAVRFHNFYLKQVTHLKPVFHSTMSMLVPTTWFVKMLNFKKKKTSKEHWRTNLWNTRYHYPAVFTFVHKPNSSFQHCTALSTESSSVCVCVCLRTCMLQWSSAIPIPKLRVDPSCGHLVLLFSGLVRQKGSPLPLLCMCLQPSFKFTCSGKEGMRSMLVDLL